jgi:hypothetical protein
MAGPPHAKSGNKTTPIPAATETRQQQKLSMSGSSRRPPCPGQPWTGRLFFGVCCPAQRHGDPLSLPAGKRLALFTSAHKHTSHITCRPFSSPFVYFLPFPPSSSSLSSLSARLYALYYYTGHASRPPHSQFPSPTAILPTPIARRDCLRCCLLLSFAHSLSVSITPPSCDSAAMY